MGINEKVVVASLPLNQKAANETIIIPWSETNPYVVITILNCSVITVIIVGIVLAQ